MSHTSTDANLAFYWQIQDPTYQLMRRIGMQKFVDQVANLRQAFQPSDRVIRCIDERVAGGIHVAGSLVLLDSVAAKEICDKANVQGITSHAGCGAAKLAYFQKHNLDATAEVDQFTVDEYAIARAKAVAEELGIPYAGHITKDELLGPSEFHTARCVYYVGTPAYDAFKVKELPAGFSVSRRYLTEEQGRSEVDLSISIALNKDHAFGSFISQDNPIVLIPVADPNDPQFSLQEMTHELEMFTEKYPGLVRVDGFVAPKVNDPQPA